MKRAWMIVATPAGRKEKYLNEVKLYLPPIYSTILPLSLSDHYDVRNPREVRERKAINQGYPPEHNSQ
jgi:hypothetical protein